MNVLMVGDVVARPGRRVLACKLQQIQECYDVEFTVVNIENAAGGLGLTKRILAEFQAMNIDVLTSGNHIWDKKEILEVIDNNSNLLRPHNYPPGTPGSGWVIKKSASGQNIGVLNVMGQAFMQPILDSPYTAVSGVLENTPDELKIILVDFHAETTSEKMAMGWFLDGHVSAMVGTHTHVPTADERILPEGTAYITDMGMTGCYDSVIGTDKKLVLDRTISKLPVRLEPATGPGSLCGVVIDINESTGKARGIERIRTELDL